MMKSIISVRRAWRAGVAALAACLALATALFAAAPTAGARSGGGQVAGQPAVQEAGATRSSGSGGKDEVIYVKASSTGQTQGVYVVNSFKPGKARRISDLGSYQSVTNLTTDERLAVADGAVSFTPAADQPFYYQGNLPASTRLPWRLRVDFRQGGKVLKPSQVAGVNGDLDLTLTVSGETGAGPVSDFATGYVLQAQGTFPQDAFEVTDDGGATLAHAGGNTVLAAMVLPGQSKAFHISGKAHDFHYSGWQVSAMPLNMALNVSDEDTTQLSEQTGQLEGATSQLAGGAGSLAAGAQALQSGAGSLSQGSGALRAGSKQLAGGISSLGDGLKSAGRGAGALSEGSSALARQLSMSSGNPASPTFSDGWRSLRSGIVASQGGAGSLAQGLARLNAGLNTGDPNSGQPSLAAAGRTLATGSGQYQQGLQQEHQAQVTAAQTAAARLTAAQGAYQTALSAFAASPSDPTKLAALNASVQALSAASAQAGAATGASQALAQASNQYGPLATGTGALNAGIQSAAQGAATASQGAQALSRGMGQLAEGSARLDGQFDASRPGSLASGAVQLDQGLGALSGALGQASGAPMDALGTGAGSLAGGAAQVDAGVKSLNSALGAAGVGAQALADGSAQLAQSVQGMDRKVLDGIQQAIDKKLGVGFKPHSFVAPENTNVNKVQFTYLLEGVERQASKEGKDQQARPAKDPNGQSFMARVKGLFASK
ncbi:hypothetical protein BACT_1001 [Bifidobacterium actinocoloniiforme DSM 22766]|uniref:Methyl-accepting chemotaxis protein n=1 Tax=Bifidobacterium actinocoloniiforme DSM 22766 TaxID=1437605 RepID=A0A086Z199_9BIFI|nr:hypothetical protein [Bifidobacterium actinocoloniiforme]AKV55461.1 hypothetical protein AB656_03615 [Bifidobacterium actinocoloniiforme DSM 22766]KFI40299.1 hypothetical protein BACT_1001 [Bifidobacterium actinocoloniiforme DSM 22766]